jgi:hypothetical protein
MVIVIHQTACTQNAFLYNEKKVEARHATFFHSRNTKAMNPFLYSKKHRLKELSDIEKQNTRVKNKCLHISLNPSESDLLKLNDRIILKEAERLMQYLGYENQPYFVYKHKDLERDHFHIVSTRIDRQMGKKIKDNHERQKVQQFIRELEIKYQLKGKQEREEPVFKFSARSRNIKQSLEELFQHLNEMSELTSKELYDEALKLFKVEVLKSGRGYIVVMTDGAGNPIRYPIRLSKFKNRPEFYAARESVKNELSTKTSLHKKLKPGKSLLKELIWQSLIYIASDAPDKKLKPKKKPKKKYRRRM